MPLFTKQYKLVLAIGWEGNRRSGVALAMRVTDSVVYPPTGSMAWERKMSTTPKIHSEYYGIFTVFATLLNYMIYHMKFVLMRDETCDDGSC